MREQQSSKNYGAAIAIVMAAIVLPIVAVSYYAYTSLYGPSTSRMASVESENDNGIVAVLGANNQFSGSNSTAPTAQAPVQQTTPAQPEFSQLPYSFDLPAGWAASAAQPCPGNAEATSTTYTNQSKSIVVYQNTRPADCGGAQAADTYLDYDFSSDGSSITTKADAIAQCSKQENPACPKGDGKVTVFIGNESPSDSTKDVPSKITNKTYFVSMTDTSISGDFATQVTELSALAKQLKIK